MLKSLLLESRSARRNVFQSRVRQNSLILVVLFFFLLAVPERSHVVEIEEGEGDLAGLKTPDWVSVHPHLTQTAIASFLHTEHRDNGRVTPQGRIWETSNKQRNYTGIR
ncbi:hypothetical protein COCSADRAFT_271624 [Bipolaris sorokiniana ND90Pr]|uniref:Uncharacterized protein n=1 Tax=Cochliobolus sativus (strain ND90Pr / ATCC 201652) TaxID=665912 RepID=M2THY9_COCSN|nr:uncharacterized protein COCSADRAFT_271624 [Bipolaris sorokiniana ND90Pr]EMD68322.1 hypothetical protein COCSADRAFT_271624 [Bipolaris sorokiniana ND90Pr]